MYYRIFFWAHGGVGAKQNAPRVIIPWDQLLKVTGSFWSRFGRSKEGWGGSRDILSDPSCTIRYDPTRYEMMMMDFSETAGAVQCRSLTVSMWV